MVFRGEFYGTLDDTGRIALPRDLRDLLDKNVVLVRGEENCLSLYTAEYWKGLEEIIFGPTNLFSQRDRAIRRKSVPSPVEIDKQGRILIPQILRDYAGLQKDCVIIGQLEYIEIWAKDRFEAYMDFSSDQRQAVNEELSISLKQKKELGNNGNNAHSGTAGTDIALSGSEGKV